MNQKTFEQMSEQERELLAGQAMLKMLEVPDLLKSVAASMQALTNALCAQTMALNALAASNEELANAVLQDLRDAQEQDSERDAHTTLDEEDTL